MHRARIRIDNLLGGTHRFLRALVGLGDAGGVGLRDLRTKSETGVDEGGGEGRGREETSRSSPLRPAKSSLAFFRRCSSRSVRRGFPRLPPTGPSVRWFPAMAPMTAEASTVLARLKQSS